MRGLVTGADWTPFSFVFVFLFSSPLSNTLVLLFLFSRSSNFASGHLGFASLHSAGVSFLCFFFFFRASLYF